MLIIDKKNNLIAVKNEFYTRRVFDNSRYYGWSEIILSENTNIVKKLHFTNYFLKFKTLRLINKFKNIKKFGWKNRQGDRCPFNKITKYLNVGHVFVGHTIQSEINSKCNNKVWRLDVGISDAFGGGGKIQVLEIDSIDNTPQFKVINL